MSDSLWPHRQQQARILCPPLSPGVCSNSCPLSWWCYLTISSSGTLFSFCPQSFSASGSFPESWLFVSGGQSIGVSASVSVFPMNIQVWFPIGLIGLISLQSKGLSRVFSSTTIWKYQFFSTQPTLWSNSHICTWLLEKPQLWLDGQSQVRVTCGHLLSDSDRITCRIIHKPGPYYLFCSHLILKNFLWDIRCRLKGGNGAEVGALSMWAIYW